MLPVPSERYVPVVESALDEDPSLDPQRYVPVTYKYIPVRTSSYLYILILDVDWPLQHAHIENIRSVANLSNNKDVFMCILRFHARYPSLRVMSNSHLTTLHITVTCSYMVVHTSTY